MHCLVSHHGTHTTTSPSVSHPRALARHLVRLYGTPILGVADHTELDELRQVNKTLQKELRSLRDTLAMETKHAQQLQQHVDSLHAEVQQLQQRAAMNANHGHKHLAGAASVWKLPSTFIERVCIPNIQDGRCVQVDGPTGRVLVAEHPRPQECCLLKVMWLRCAVVDQHVEVCCC